MTSGEPVLLGTMKQVLEGKGRQVFTIDPGATISEAIREMNAREVGALVVVRSDRPVGIFTERDVLRKLEGGGLDPAETKVSKLMSQGLVVVTEEVTVGEAMAIMTQKRCRHLPVVEQGKLVGLVSSGDMALWLTRRQEIHIKDLTDYILGNYPV